ncbi:hypothetical protein SDC9_161335 [bioreactor metagenome]|uniref:Uncharacterized protein n=1 Tax=bioreactor metagenome TaxID=1076179 RepID=A0A645FKZ6_9ZZZZ
MKFTKNYQMLIFTQLKAYHLYTTINTNKKFTENVLDLGFALKQSLYIIQVHGTVH